MNLTKFLVRPATKNDVPLILQFIKELAEFEKLSHEVVATEELLADSLFGKHPAAETIIGEFNGEPVAFAIFFQSFSTFLGRPGLYLEDLYVKPAARSNGFGKLMLAHLAKQALDRGCPRLEWAVLDWNKEAVRFYESLGALPNNEWTVYRLTGTSLAQFAGTKA